MRGFLSNFNFNTIKGRTILLVSVYLFILITYSIVNFYQIDTISSSLDKILRVRILVNTQVSEILASVNQSSAIQRDYMLTGNDAFKIKRKNIWETEIGPSVKELRIAVADIENTEDINLIDSLESTLNSYKEEQENLERYISGNSNLIKNKDFDIDEESAFQTLMGLQEKATLEIEMNSLLDDKIRPKKAQIERVVKALSDSQKYQLEGEVEVFHQKFITGRISIAIILVLAIVLTYIFTHSLISKLDRSIKGPTKLLNKLADGELPKDMPETKDELNAVIRAGNQVKQNLLKASNFATQIGEGTYNSGFSPNSEKDILGNALLQMRDKLKSVAEDDKKRNWTTEGLAKFSDILRGKGDEDFQALGDRIISTIVRYVGANQGSLFIINDDKSDNKFLEMVACYAYDKKRFVDKNISIENEAFAEGLIGQAFLEKSTIHINDVPEDYVEITSGLGDATPTNLIIVPLKINEEVEGVIEIASFYPFDRYQIEFVERLGESIASSIHSVKVNEKTKKLLQSTQVQAEQLKAQEEEMRQNMEELSATQEEMQRKSQEMEVKLIQSAKLEKALQKKQLENLEKFQEAESYLNSQHPFVAIDNQYVICFYNKAAKNFDPIHSENLERSCYLPDLFPSTIQHKVKTSVDQAFTGNASSIEWKHSGPESTHWFNLYIFPIKNQQQQISSTGVYFVDITDKKSLIKSLEEQNEKLAMEKVTLSEQVRSLKEKEANIKKESEKKSKDLIENSCFIQLEFDQKTGESGFTYTSIKIQDILGFTKDEFLKLNLEDLQELVHPKEQEAFAENLAKLFNEQKTFSWMGKLQSNNGFLKRIYFHIVSIEKEGSKLLIEINMIEK